MTTLENTSSPLPTGAAALCPTCKKIYALKLFTRKLTRLQSKAMGYKGDFPLVVESKHCKYCNAKKVVGLPKMSANQLNNKAMSGDLSAAWVEAELKKRVEKVYDAQVRGGIEGAARRKKAVWEPLIAEIQVEIQALNQQKSNALRTGKRELAELLDMLQKMHRVAKGVLELNQRRVLSVTYEPMVSADWREYFVTDEVRIAAAAWGALPRLHTSTRVPRILDKGYVALLPEKIKAVDRLPEKSVTPVTKPSPVVDWTQL